MPFSTPPTFINPAQKPIDLTGATVGQTVQVLSTGPVKLGLGASGGGGGGGSLPGRIAFNVASGVTNNLNPGGAWPTAIARLLANPTAGNAEVTGLVAGTDGQLVLFWNAAAIGGNTIQLDNLAAGSAAANQFSFAAASLIIPPQSGWWLIYDGTLTQWLVKS